MITEGLKVIYVKTTYPIFDFQIYLERILWLQINI
jgi:hypothetical protein